MAQKTIIEHALRDFRLSGIDLPADQQQRYAEVQSKLSELGSRFSNQLLDATQAWTKHVTDEAALAGLTDSAKAQMAAAAQAKGLDGWLITLEFPSYYAVMTYASDRALREELYAAYCTRASDQGPNAGQFDNGPVMEQILDLRQELAKLLGYPNSPLSLATKMAESSDQVLSFLRDLAKRSKPFAARTCSSSRPTPPNRAARTGQLGRRFLGEKLREQRYSVSQEALRAYFPIDKVLSGLFAIVQRCTASRSPSSRASTPGTRTCACSRSRKTASTSAASSSTSTPAPTSVAAPGWTAPATVAAPRPAAAEPGGQPGVQLHPGRAWQACAADPR
jgi:oligopeptidase A